MNLPEIIASSSIFLGIGFTIGINHREYKDAKKWLLTHGINRNFYEKKVNNFKERSFRGKIYYFLGFPGRSLAYNKYTSLHHCEK